MYSCFVAPKEPNQVTVITRKIFVYNPHSTLSARIDLRAFTSLSATIHFASLIVETPKLHSRDMTDIAAAEYTLSLTGAHRPSISFTDRRPLYHIEGPCLDSIHQPPDNCRMEWLVKSKFLDAFRLLEEHRVPIPFTKSAEKSWPTRGTLS